MSKQDEFGNELFEHPFTGPISRKHREHLITKLCDNLAEHVDMDTLIACFYEDQYRYFDKEADSSELLEWLVSTETITEEEANELEKNGF